jgi:Bacterial regulatory proteins, luxR family
MELANKEIAASLNLSERTVKFHVSSLLIKFRVRGRMELAEANRRTLASVTGPHSFASREARDYAAAPASSDSAPHATEVQKTLSRILEPSRATR